MDDKELEKDELVDEEIVEAEASENKEENKDWEFDGKATTLENELELDAEYKVEIPEETATASAEIENSHGAKKGINKKALKYSLISIAAVAVVAIITAVCVWAFAFPNSNERMTPANTAMTIGDTDVSVGMYNYYYSSTVQSYLQNAQYGYNNIDPTADYATQYTTDKDGNEVSWLDVFKQDTINQLQYVVAYYEEAVENGVGLTEAQEAQIDDYIKGIRESASQANMSVDAYLSKQYGEYCGLATMKKVFEQSGIASNYYNQISADNSVDKEDVDAYFEANKTNYLSVKFSCLEILGDGTDEKAIADLKANAEKYNSQIKDKSTIKALIPEACSRLIDQYIDYGYFQSRNQAIEALEEASEMTQTYTNVKQQFGDDIANWLISDDNMGETKYYVNEEYGFAYIFLKTDKAFFPETERYSVRHILVFPEKAEEEETTNETQNEETTEVTYTEEEWNTALDKANSIIDEYNKGDKTEASFALLAEKYSDDTGSLSSSGTGFFGGNYEGVSLGEMVPEFEGWAVDASRQYGDIGVVKSKFGYHVMFFINHGPEYQIKATTDFKLEKIAENEKALAEKHAVTEKSAMKRTNVAEPIAPESTEND